VGPVGASELSEKVAVVAILGASLSVPTSKYVLKVMVGEATKNLDASERIWKFFSRPTWTPLELLLLVVGIIRLRVGMVLLSPGREQTVCRGVRWWRRCGNACCF
jgi:hypothetical protein